MACGALTGTAATLPSLPTTSTVAPCAPRISARCGTVSAFSSTPCSIFTRTKVPDSSSRFGLGNCARSVIAPVVGSTVMSENSSLPVCSYSRPSSTYRCTLAPPLTPLTAPDSMARRRRVTSEAGWVKVTHIGSTCSTSASLVASPLPTSAPSVTSARPARPLIGAVTVV
ncbi:hypothetical protein D3C72_1544220 [compost metagenome]